MSLTHTLQRLFQPIQRYPQNTSYNNSNSPTYYDTSETQQAFTLIELLTVVAILATILIPAVSKVRLSANSTKSTSNLKKIGSLANLYASENGGRLPATGGEWDDFYIKVLYPMSEGRPYSEDITSAPLGGTIYHSPLDETLTLCLMP